MRNGIRKTRANPMLSISATGRGHNEGGYDQPWKTNIIRHYLYEFANAS
jgi:hypothetical protein